MQCYVCMAYMIFICSAFPSKDKVIETKHDERSLFRDVIESLRIRSQLPDDEVSHNDENNIADNYERYGFENEHHISSDFEYMPRRNDRIEMPTLKYRFPKSLDFKKNESKNIGVTESPKEEIVLYIQTTRDVETTTKPKKPQKRVKPNKQQKIEEEEIVEETVTEQNENNPSLPLSNTMAGQSQIGNRESQLVVKPTVIVNFRGTVSHRDSDIRLFGRNTELNRTNGMQDLTGPPQNVFNIKQEVKLERTFSGMGSRGAPKKAFDGKVKIQGKTVPEDNDIDLNNPSKWSVSTYQNEEARNGRDVNVLEILVSV